MASGTGALKFTVPVGKPGGSVGAFFANFSDDLATQFGENSEFYVQWRQRFTPEFIVAGNPGAGFKQSIIGTGSRPGTPASSCTDLEVVTQNTNAPGFPQMYNSCAGAPRNYEPLLQSFGSTDYKLQNARPSPYCLYSQGKTSPITYFPPSGNCSGYFANEWMTFQVHIKTGPRVQMAWSGCNNPCWFFQNSTVELWVARENKPSELVISFPSYHLEATANSADKYGQVWLLPYSGTDTWAANATTWYDELIISRTKIADPTGGGTGGGGTTTPPAAPTALTIK
jgi:hypothetical protein